MKSHLKRYCFGWIILGIMVLCALVWLIVWPRSPGGQVAMTSVSSDGHYAITTDAKNTAIVWDLRNKTHKIISHDANMYSAYWIKHTPYYMWQNLKTKKIRITDVKTGKTIYVLHPSFLVYGQVMSSDLRYHVVSDIDWDIYVWTKQHNLKLMAPHYNGNSGFFNKLINFTLLGNNKVLASGFTNAVPEAPQEGVGVYLWDLKTRKPLQVYQGNQGITIATVSPDGQYVVAGDEEGLSFVWDRKTGKRLFRLYDIMFGKDIITGPADDDFKWDKSVLKVLPPRDFFTDGNTAADNGILAIKFIDKTHYLRFTTRDYYAILYKVTDPSPLKYFYLGRYPMPSVDHYERDQSIDTSASAHILVMGKASHGGILVYRYDPKKQTLKKIWDS